MARNLSWKSVPALRQLFKAVLDRVEVRQIPRIGQHFSVTYNSLPIDDKSRTFAHSLEAHQVFIDGAVSARRFLVVIGQQRKLIVLLFSPGIERKRAVGG